jgi:hypothetical protein
MEPETPPEKNMPNLSRHVTAHDYVEAVIEDLRFLQAWERGDVPLLGAILRVRQIRRANPALHENEMA